MNANPHPNPVPQTECRIESFPEQRTIPDGWDLSELMSPVSPYRTAFHFNYSNQEELDANESVWNNR